MHRPTVLLAALALAWLANAPHVRAEDWKTLFGGVDLSGWKAVEGPMDSWKVEDGMLYLSLIHI